MAGRLEGRVAVVTGGAGGIGAATGRLFCEEGAKVALVDRDAQAMSAVLAEIRGAVPGAEMLDVIVDLAEEASAATIVAETRRACGRIDVLVNNAGIRSYEPLAEAKRETWETIIAVNLLSYVYLAREALPDLRASGRGSIVNVSSTRTLAFEEAPHGVRVNAVCPGATFTPFHRKRAEALGRTQAEIDREAETTCLMRRWAEPREIAYPILWLASNEASYVTGAPLMVDGGRLVI